MRSMIGQSGVFSAAGGLAEVNPAVDPASSARGAEVAWRERVGETRWVYDVPLSPRVRECVIIEPPHAYDHHVRMLDGSEEWFTAVECMLDEKGAWSHAVHELTEQLEYAKMRMAAAGAEPLAGDPSFAGEVAAHAAANAANAAHGATAYVAVYVPAETGGCFKVLTFAERERQQALRNAALACPEGYVKVELPTGDAIVIPVGMYEAAMAGTFG